MEVKLLHQIGEAKLFCNGRDHYIVQQGHTPKITGKCWCGLKQEAGKEG